MNGKKKQDQDFPPCEIRIDKDGVWYFRGDEMFRKDIVNLFYQSLRRDPSGRYVIEMANERCYLDVEDTPFVVKTVHVAGSPSRGDETILLTLIDDTVEKLDPKTLRVGCDHVLYCKVRKGEFEARFSRASYYQIADFFNYDPGNDRYFLPLNGIPYYIDKELHQP